LNANSSLGPDHDKMQALPYRKPSFNCSKRI
jgi:hypothetical protein